MSMRSPQGARLHSPRGSTRLTRTVGHEGARSGSLEHALSERGEAHARGTPLVVEPFETRVEVGAAPALDRDLFGQVVCGIRGRIRQRGVLHEDADAVRANLRRDLAQRTPEFGAGGARERARGVHDDRGDRAGHLALMEPDAVGDAAREQPPLVNRVAEPLGGVAKSRRCATRDLFVLTGAGIPSADRPRSRRRRGRPGTRDRCRRVHGAGRPAREPPRGEGLRAAPDAHLRSRTRHGYAEPRGALHEAAFGSMRASSIVHG